jgi:hypothetical protein
MWKTQERPQVACSGMLFFEKYTDMGELRKWGSLEY